MTRNSKKVDEAGDWHKIRPLDSENLGRLSQEKEPYLSVSG
jgi:hypothetical protein